MNLLRLIHFPADPPDSSSDIMEKAEKHNLATEERRNRNPGSDSAPLLRGKFKNMENGFFEVNVPSTSFASGDGHNIEYIRQLYVTMTQLYGAFLF